MNLNHQNLRHLSQASVILALTIIFGFFPGIPIAIIPVTIVLQNLGMMLSGEILGPWWGAGTMLTFLTLVALGLPLLSGGNGGLQMILSPAGCYLIMWVVAAFVMSWLLRVTFLRKYWWSELITVWICGALLVDLLGGLLLSWWMHFSLTITLGAMMIYLPGDTIKVCLSVLITRRMRKSKLID